MAAPEGTPLFDLGRISVTPAALEALEAASLPAVLGLLRRHREGDWGDVPKADARENARSLKYGWRVLSSYAINGERVWIITEADRSSTCILVPEEY